MTLLIQLKIDLAVIGDPLYITRSYIKNSVATLVNVSSFPKKMPDPGLQ